MNAIYFIMVLILENVIIGACVEKKYLVLGLILMVRKLQKKMVFYNKLLLNIYFKQHTLNTDRCNFRY